MKIKQRKYTTMKIKERKLVCVKVERSFHIYNSILSDKWTIYLKNLLQFNLIISYNTNYLF